MMIKIHCNQLSDFLKIYLFDWHVLCALIIPFLFATFFPVYWFLICPAVWKTDLNLYRPRSWLLGYWLLASLIWFVFLVVCFYHMRNDRKLATAMNGKSANCLTNKSYSTEDLWNEDAYIPESYLPTPEYMVNMTQALIENPVFGFYDSAQTHLTQVQPPTEQYLKRPTLKTPSKRSTEIEEEQCLLPPPKDFQTPEPKDESVDFDVILASLQSLALELERDFDVVVKHDAMSLQGYTSSMVPMTSTKTKSAGDLSDKNLP